MLQQWISEAEVQVWEPEESRFESQHYVFEVFGVSVSVRWEDGAVLVQVERAESAEDEPTDDPLWIRVELGGDEVGSALAR